MKVKSFIYLDDYKMYSFSSQLFEGITQYILKEDVQASEEQNSQKGSFLSGRFMADMMFQKNAQTEMRYLHDFAFNLFEKELESRVMLFDIVNTTTIDELHDKGFVRVRGKVVFEDYSRLLYTLEHFNEIGRAFGELQDIDTVKFLANAKEQIKKQKDRGQKFRQNQSVKKTENLIEEEYKKLGLIIDEKVKNNIHKLLSYAYRDCYEVRFSLDGSTNIYTAVINQEYLKETEQSLISKYSRQSEKEFTLLGVVSQSGNTKAQLPDVSGKGIKEAVTNVIDKMAVLENNFNGRSENECIIDPIAIFTEI